MLRLLKLMIIAWILFAFAAVANNGGYKIRSMEEDTHRVISKTINIVADKADSLKEQADAAKEKVKNLAGAKKEVAQSEEPLPGKKSKIR
ncbi:MAG TPA: hypothetical protein VMB78_00320 [Dissulfurispiraceae bacterium]|nr:hypothetical protein [Dissulfurispiraceae bacterium]